MAARKKADIPGKIVEATLDLVRLQGWRHTTMADIATAARISLADLYRHFPGKAAILASFVRSIDQAVLEGDDPEASEESPRDRLFDVLMRRFDALTPHKEAVRVIIREAGRDPLAVACGGLSFGRSMACMLEAARIDSSGVTGLLRVKGLGALYLGVVRVWMDDDTDDLSKTMAALDKRLRRAEDLLHLCRGRRRRGQAAAAAS